MRVLPLFLLVLCCVSTRADVPFLDGGHIKGRWLGTDYPDDSVFNEALGSNAQDQGAIQGATQSGIEAIR